PGHVDPRGLPSFPTRRSSDLSRSAPSRRARSSSGRSTHSSTKARALSNSGLRCAPRISIPSTSTATASRRGAADRCSTRTASGSRAFTRASRSSTRSSAPGGRRRRCSSASRARAERSGDSIASDLQGTMTIGRATPLRTPRVLPADVVITRGGDGTLHAVSPHPLGAYPERITDRLVHWAAVAPDRPFLAERADDGGWRRLTYGEAHARVRAIAQALIDRGLSRDRTV